MDYFLTDGDLVPRGAERLFSETVYRLPRLCWVFQPPADMPPVATLPVRARGHITFGCFSRLVRINDRVLAAWSRILAAVQGSRLVLDAKPFKEAESQRLFEDRLRAHGIAPERVDLGYSSPQRAFWETYNGIDIALDPFPHNAGVTTFEALWMGVPVVSLMDRPPLGRFGATILSSAGLHEWLAEDIDAYVRIAVEKSRDADALARLRANLRQAVARSAICDAQGFAASVEQAYRQMVQQSTPGASSTLDRGAMGSPGQRYNGQGNGQND
jgi:predicted O-linked N-acetylglucosamine transferase (SPINDLY family)